MIKKILSPFLNFLLLYCAGIGGMYIYGFMGNYIREKELYNLPPSSSAMINIIFLLLLFVYIICVIWGINRLILKFEKLEKAHLSDHLRQSALSYLLILLILSLGVLYDWDLSPLFSSSEQGTSIIVIILFLLSFPNILINFLVILRRSRHTSI